ncbi:hypothetical protein ABZU52_12585, partial [Micromonospora sp. NPDC005220]
MITRPGRGAGGPGRGWAGPGRGWAGPGCGWAGPGRTVRVTKRARRTRNSVPAVAIAGYTNAGKSS